MRIKIFFAAIFTLFCFTYSFSAGVPIAVSMDIPKFISPGANIIVNLSVERGEIEGYVKVEEFFPIGIEIKEIESGGAQFSFEHNYLTLLWNDIPKDDVIKVKFKMFVPATIEGKGRIEGGVYFTMNKKLSNIKFDDLDVTFQKEDADEETTNEVETPQKVIVGPPTKSKGSIERQPRPEQPVTVSAKRNYKVLNNDEVVIEMNIEQMGLSGFLKYEDFIPMGFKAKSDNSAGSTFSFIDNKVKLVWSEVPKETKIAATYKIIRDGNDAKKLTLEGSIQYLDKGETKKIDLNDEVNFDFKQAEGIEKVNISNSSTNAPAGNVAAGNAKLNNAKNGATNDNSKPADKAVAKKVVEKTANAASKNVVKGIVYKVQICATQNKSDVNKVSQEFNVVEPIEAEMQDGWYKYTIGSYTNYADAKAFRDINSSIPTSPFVAAYYDGKRISVQEANMINNQKLMK